MKLYFRTRESAEAFLTPLHNELQDSLGETKVGRSTDNEFWDWQLEIECPKSRERLIRGIKEGFMWGIEHGSGKYLWNEIQQRCTYGVGCHPDWPEGTRVRRIAIDDNNPPHRPPPPEIGEEGKVVGCNGDAIIIQFDHVSYPRKPGGSLGDYLFKEDIERV